MHKANIVAFIKTNFLRPVLTFANTPFKFFAFYTSSSSPNFSFFIFLYSWGVCTFLRKILDTLDEKSQRNNLSKLGTLKYEFPQLWHSALLPGVKPNVCKMTQGGQADKLHWEQKIITSLNGRVV